MQQMVSFPLDQDNVIDLQVCHIDRGNRHPLTTLDESSHRIALRSDIDRATQLQLGKGVVDPTQLILIL